MENLIFIDESGANLQMHLRYGRAYKGERALLSAPYHRGNYFTIVGAISLDKIEAIGYCKGNGDTEVFSRFLSELLCPNLNQAHVIVMDNVKFHKNEKVRNLIESSGARIIYTPPHSPEFNPIEEMWSKVKGSLRKTAARTIDKFSIRIKGALRSVKSSDLYGWFKHAGYIDQYFREPL